MTLLFADVCLDADSRRIRRGSRSLHLTRKAFDLLLLLIEHRPKAVPKEVIHQRLWPDTFVSESSLQALVSEIRQALGDDGRRQEIVRTIHGVGYAFDAPATTAPPHSAETAAAWLVGAVSRLPLQCGDNILGRGGDGVIEVDDTTVSRRHACIHVGTLSTLEDLNSKNGTWRGDDPVHGPLPLVDGDVIRLGSAQFTFRVSRAAVSTDTLPGLRPS